MHSCDDRGARFTTSTECEQRGAQASGRTRARQVRDRAGAGSVQLRRPLRVALLELLDGGGVGTLLRTEDPCGPVLAEQRVLDVGGGDQLDRREPSARPVQTAQRGDHSAPTVGAAGPAETDDDPSGARVDRGVDQLPHPTAVRIEGAARGRWPVEQPEPDGLRRFDVRGVGGEHPARVGRPAERSLHPNGPDSPDGGRNHVDESRAAVGLRCEHDDIVGSRGLPPGGHRLGRLYSSEGFTERVGGDEHTHQRSVWRCPDLGISGRVLVVPRWSVSPARQLSHSLDA